MKNPIQLGEDVAESFSCVSVKLVRASVRNRAWPSGLVAFRCYSRCENGRSEMAAPLFLYNAALSSMLLKVRANESSLILTMSVASSSDVCVSELCAGSSTSNKPDSGTS